MAARCLSHGCRGRFCTHIKKYIYSIICYLFPKLDAPFFIQRMGTSCFTKTMVWYDIQTFFASEILMVERLQCSFFVNGRNISRLARNFEATAQRTIVKGTIFRIFGNTLLETDSRICLLGACKAPTVCSNIVHHGYGRESCWQAAMHRHFCWKRYVASAYWSTLSQEMF